MKLTRGAGGSAGGPTQSIPTVAGTWYKLTFTATAGAGGAGVAFRVDSGILGSLVAGVGTKTAYFLATGASASPYFWNINTNAVDYIDSVTVAAMPGNHATQSTTAAKPTLQAGYVALDRFDDFLASTTGGGGTTGILLCAGIRAGGAGAARTIWSDRGASTGYRLSVNASNQLVLSAGNGSAHTDCVGPTITAGTDYVVMGWHDGTNLNVRVGLAAATAQAFATAAAGTAGFTVGRDNGAATGYYGDRVYALAYRKNDTSTSAQRDGLTRWVAQKANITL